MLDGVPNIPAARQANAVKRAAARRKRPDEPGSLNRAEDAVDLNAGERMAEVNPADDLRTAEHATGEEASEDRTAHASRVGDRAGEPGGRFSGGLDLRA